MSSSRESGGSSHSHGHTHHGSQRDPGFIAERLLQLKDSDPDLFSEAWKKIPQSTQDNIIAYLRKHGSEDKLASVRHSTFEDQNSHSKQRGTEHSEPERLGHRTQEKTTHASSPALEPRRAGQGSGRPLFEWTDGELLAHTVIDSETKNSSEPGKTDDDLALELRKISRQNTVQIVQNELIRRLLQTIAGKS